MSCMRVGGCRAMWCSSSSRCLGNARSRRRCIFPCGALSSLATLGADDGAFPLWRTSQAVASTMGRQLDDAALHAFVGCSAGLGEGGRAVRFGRPTSLFGCYRSSGSASTLASVRVCACVCACLVPDRCTLPCRGSQAEVSAGSLFRLGRRAGSVALGPGASRAFRCFGGAAPGD